MLSPPYLGLFYPLKQGAILKLQICAVPCHSCQPDHTWAATPGTTPLGNSSTQPLAKAWVYQSPLSHTPASSLPIPAPAQAPPRHGAALSRLGLWGHSLHPVPFNLDLLLHPLGTVYDPIACPPLIPGGKGAQHSHLGVFCRLLHNSLHLSH